MEDRRDAKISVSAGERCSSALLSLILLVDEWLVDEVAPTEPASASLVAPSHSLSLSFSLSSPFPLSPAALSGAEERSQIQM